MITLFFEINKEFRKYTVIEYKLKDGFYEFTDIKDGEFRRLPKKWYRGQEGGEHHG